MAVKRFTLTLIVTFQHAQINANLITTNPTNLTLNKLDNILEKCYQRLLGFNNCDFMGI